MRGFTNGVVFPNVNYWVDPNPAWSGVYYKALQNKCPYGGVRSGNEHCQLMTLPLNANVNYWVDANPDWPGIYYKQP